MTDRVATADLAEWCTRPWLRAWDQWLDQQPRVLWVVAVTTDEALPATVTTRFGTRIPFAPPDGRTVYHLLRKLLVRQYGHVRTRMAAANHPRPPACPSSKTSTPLPPLPTASPLPRVVCRPRGLVPEAVCHCTRLAMTENVVYEAGRMASGGTPKTLSNPTPQPDHDYRLVYRLDHDKLEWCPAHAA